MIRNIAIIKELTTTDEMLVQLAEEAAELAHAALKLRRTIIKGNPTPVTKDEAYQNILEECGDISLCLEVLGINNSMDRMRVDKIKREKAERWAERLQEV